MNIIPSNSHEQKFFSWDLKGENRTFSLQEATRITSSTNLNKDITLFTDDGDRVTISYGQNSRSLYASYSSLYQQRSFSQEQDGPVFSKQIATSHDELSASSREYDLSITVQGDLSNQELEDVRKALNGIDKIMTKMLRGGDVLKEAKKAAKIPDLESISAIDADYRYQIVITLEHVVYEEASTYSQYGMLEDNAPVKAGPLHNQLQDLIDQMTKIVKDTKITPSYFTKPIEKLFTDFMDNLEIEEPHDLVKHHLIKQIRNALLNKIKKLPGF
jgi:hypothetical protein